MRIVPALEEATIQEFERKLKILSSFAPAIQLDFNDGSFADFKTVTSEVVSRQIVATSGHVSLEAHLMVQKPFDFIPKLLESGVRKFYIQYEIDANLRDVLEQLENEDVVVGLSISPQTPVSDLEPFIDLITCVNVMTIDTGKQGQPFLPFNLSKISDLRNSGFGGEIAIDGGLDKETISQAIQFPVDTLVVGHYIGGSEDPEGKYVELCQLAKLG